MVWILVIPPLARTAFYVIPLALLYPVYAWGLWRFPTAFGGMYGNTDGMWMAWNIRAILQWSIPSDVAPFNPLAGMGSTFAAYVPWLNPGALALALPLPRDLTYLVSYTVYFAEAWISNLLLFRTLGLSPVLRPVGAQLYAVALFPPWSDAVGTLPWLSLAPVNAHLASVANLALASFASLGRRSARGNWVAATWAVAAVLSGVLSAPMLLPAYVPVYGLVAAVLFMREMSDRRALAWKLGTVGAAGIVVWALGIPMYLLATAEVSARSQGYPPVFATGSRAFGLDFWAKLWEQFDVCGRPEILLCGQRPVFWLHAGAVIGAVIALTRRGSPLRPLAAVVLCYYGFVHFYELVSADLLFGRLHVLSTPYLVWSAYPFFVLFCAVLVGTLAERAALLLSGTAPVLRRVMRGHASWASPPLALGICRWGLALCAVPAVAWYLWLLVIAPDQQPPPAHKRAACLLPPSSVREPVPSPVTSYLARHASVRPRTAFRGYSATYFGNAAGHVREATGVADGKMSWLVYVGTRQYLDEHYGNRFQETDLWELGIPTFEEYGQWVTKQAQAFATALFAVPGDDPHTVFLRIYRLDLDLLPAVGVRFLITDTALADPRAALRVEQTSPTAGPIYLYELAGANLGTWSPTRPIRAATFAEGMAAVRLHRASLADDVVVFDDLQGPFVPARSAAVRLTRGGLRVVAESPGRSLLLLPVQFSRCFELRPARSDGDLASARLTRANGIQTLLEFHGRIDVRLRFKAGPLTAGRCRGRDARELEALGVK